MGGLGYIGAWMWLGWDQRVTGTPWRRSGCQLCRMNRCVTASRCHGVTVRQGGEDLRLDQRIQQLFNVMNGVFASNPATAQRAMRVATYAVVPMTPSVGVIEWVKHTQPIKVGGAADLATRPLWRHSMITRVVSHHHALGPSSLKPSLPPPTDHPRTLTPTLHRHRRAYEWLYGS
jgi:hypothetical protein